ncbi:class I SAM-dependent methyltransferase [Sphingomonas sp. MMS24-J13]|uniref:class I SAM-dependent methyltransferase n=1 Tax=Sphingomonas sp. MMS24-J13 TaxID=3238686 RepID=UPI00384BF4AA
MKHIGLAVLIAGSVISSAASSEPSAAIRAAVANPARLESERARDAYRHPAETLAFFKVAPGQTVVEYSPGGGWFTRILVPLLSGHGTYIAAVGKSTRSQEGARKMLATIPGGAGAQVIPFDPTTATLAPAGVADTVLTFRNVHNLLMPEDSGVADDSVAKAFFAAAFKALKPGGVLGIEDHRLPENASAEREKTSGYVKRSTVVRLATAAGFRLDGESEVNANPKDTHDWPKGVWTLPPSLELGEVDRAKYLAIGESDRMTLRFVKPK